MENKLYNDMTLLVDGKQAFPKIIECINNAKNYIKINMFIWRDDEIGNSIAIALLNAASRGVKIEISKDRYGLVLEKCEESKKSFFHHKHTAIESLKILSLKLAYPLNNVEKNGKSTENELYKKIINHPNIKVEKDTFKADHSKYYIIDDALILGGVNIEDKENGKDKQGREYQDYMILLKGKEYVDSFLNKLSNKENTSNDYFFGINKNDKNDRYFEMENLYLDMIKNAKTELTITMAYFSSLTNFVNEIVNAHKRGVNINIMVSENANFQDDTNKKTIKKLLKLTDNKINVYLSPKMLHTKMVINDDYISIGSTNITKKAFNQLSELNLFVKNINSTLKDTLTESIKENYKIATRVDNYKQIKYNKIKANIESILV